MLRKQSLYMLSMHEPISAIMAALAEKMQMEVQVNPLEAQKFAQIYANFNHAIMLDEILRDIFNSQDVAQSLQPRMLEPCRHLMHIGFERRHAEYVTAKVTKLAMMIISGGIPPDVLKRPDNHWSQIEPNDLWFYTYEPKDADPTDSGY